MPQQTRQLAAIMFTDIVGYTELMGKDSNRALDLIKKRKEIQLPIVKKHNGNWLKEIGDGTMIQFNTALDAVNCAIEIQKISRNRFKGSIRIGIHIGDITRINNEVYGDGVNIAARLESIADPGGIYISESVEKAIRGQSDVQAVYLGEIQLKNVDYDVRTYALQGDGLPVPELIETKNISGHFWAEIQRKRILHTAFTYIVTALLLNLLVSNLQLWIDLPDWLDTALIIFLIIGFPLALYLAWHFERSPEGFIRTTSNQSWRNPYPANQRKPLTSNSTLVGLVIMIVVLFGNNQYQKSQNRIEKTSTNVNINDKSIAVLPFVNMSNDPEQDYFSEGITEEIIARLSQLKDLRVISRTSIIAYKANTKNIREIARDLNVRTILEGSVRRSGDKLRITAQLIDATTDQHLWTEIFDRESKDVFEIQSNVALAIAEKFELSVSPSLEIMLSDRPTSSFEAYDLYLKARSVAFNFAGMGVGSSFTSNEQSIILLKKALVIDPQYTQALGLLSQVYADLGSRIPERKYLLDSAVIIAEEAIRINPESIEGYIALGTAVGLKNGEKDALPWYEKVFELDPSKGLLELGRCYYRMGNLPAAMQYFSRKTELNPIQYDGYLGIAKIYMDLGSEDSVKKYLETAKILNPDARDIYGTEAEYYQFRGEPALTEAPARKYFDSDTLNYNKAMAISHLFQKDWYGAEGYYNRTHYRDMDVGLVLIRTERQDSGRLFLERALDYRLELGDRAWPGDLSRIYTMLGEKDKGLHYLRKNIENGWHNYFWFKTDPFWDEIRKTEEFKQIDREFEKKNTEMFLEIRSNQKNKNL
jgi:TolB-like protein/class 3 adenylate cyclase